MVGGATGALGEAKVLRLLLREESEVEDHLDEVALGGVVALILVVIFDELVAVLSCGGEVLEVVEVLLVGEDVVAVGALHLALAHGGLSETLERVVVEDVHAECCASVLLLLDRPVSVLIINGVVVVVEVLIDLKVANAEERKDLADGLVDDVTEDDEDQEHPEGHKEGHGDVLARV